MALKLQELQAREAITNPDGTPSRYLLQYLRSRGGALTDIEAATILLDGKVTDLDTKKVDKTTQVIAGTGMTGGGALSGNVTLNVNIEGLLNGYSTTQGSVLYRGSTGWAALPPGTAGYVLTTGGAGADPSWAVGGGGSSDIQSLLDGISTTQGTVIYRDGTDWVALSPGTAGQLLKTNGAGANPSWASQTTYNIQTMLDGISSTRGTVLYRGASGWAALTPGTSGQFLKTNGSGSDPAWASQTTYDIQTMLDGISSTRGTVLYRGASGWSALAPGTSGHFLKTNGAGADPSWDAAGSSANIQTLLDSISSTRGTVLFRGASAWQALSPGPAGYVLQTKGAGLDPAWEQDAYGSSGGGTRPSVVQYASSAGNSGAVTLPAAPTNGNLLVAFATHYNNVTATGFSNGWNVLLNRNGASTDGNTIATKIVDGDDGATITVFANVSGCCITVFEIQNSSGVTFIPWKDIQEQTGLTTTTLKVGIPRDNCLLVGQFATVQASAAPTGVSGATAGTTVTGTSTSASPRQTTPFSNNTVTKGSQTVTATYAATPRSYGFAAVVLPV